MRPLRSSSLKCSHVAQRGTRFELAMSTRGASACVLNTPTGLPDWISSDSSSPRSRNAARIASKHSQLRAARPMPPYTTSSLGFSATSGSRLFWIMRSAAFGEPALRRALRCRAARESRGRRSACPTRRGGELIGIVTVHGNLPRAVSGLLSRMRRRRVGRSSRREPEAIPRVCRGRVTPKCAQIAPSPPGCCPKARLRRCSAC